MPALGGSHHAGGCAVMPNLNFPEEFRFTFNRGITSSRTRDVLDGLILVVRRRSRVIASGGRFFTGGRNHSGMGHKPKGLIRSLSSTRKSMKTGFRYQRRLLWIVAACLSGASSWSVDTGESVHRTLVAVAQRTSSPSVMLAQVAGGPPAPVGLGAALKHAAKTAGDTEVAAAVEYNDAHIRLRNARPDHAAELLKVLETIGDEFTLHWLGGTETSSPTNLPPELIQKTQQRIEARLSGGKKNDAARRVGGRLLCVAVADVTCNALEVDQKAVLWAWLKEEGSQPEIRAQLDKISREPITASTSEGITPALVRARAQGYATCFQNGQTARPSGLPQ